MPKIKFCVKTWMGSIFVSGLRDQNFGENGAQGSKQRQENRDQWVPDIPCYDPEVHMKISKNEVKCVVPENIHTPTEGKGKFRGGGGPKGGNFRGGG